MSTAKPRSLLRIQYEEAAEAYLRSLPPEHFMEATAQGTQRKITLESFDLVHARRPDVQVFNEPLIQYPFGRQQEIRQVVPDNVLILCDEPIKARGSYDLPLQPARPFWVLEYVSKYTKRKDYENSFGKYERHLKVRYLLLFYPDEQELSLYQHTGKRYRTVRPNEQGRYPVPELEIEVALLDGWVRFWYQGELLPLPADLQRDLDEARRQVAEERQTRLAAEREAAAERQTRLTAEHEAAAERQARLAAEREGAAERQARLAAEREAAELRAELAQLRSRPRNHR
jgi:Uma2 family endonuclease